MSFCHVCIDCSCLLELFHVGALPVLAKYGRFPSCPRVYFLPDAAQGRLDWVKEFATFPSAAAKSKKNKASIAEQVKASAPALVGSDTSSSSSTAVTAATPAAHSRKVILEVCSGHGDWIVQHAENEDHIDWVCNNGIACSDELVWFDWFALTE